MPNVTCHYYKKIITIIINDKIWCSIRHAWVGYDCSKGGKRRLLSDLDICACIFQENVPIETFNISFESTRNKQQYGTKITCTEVRSGGVGGDLWRLEMFSNFFKLFRVLTYSPPKQKQAKASNIILQKQTTTLVKKERERVYAKV